MLEQGFNDEEAKTFWDILKYARASQTTTAKDSLKNYIKNQIDTLVGNED
jgi:hypothetical protein